MSVDPTNPTSIALQNAILANDVTAMSKIMLYFDDTRALADAFRFAPERRDELLTPSENRLNDPDVAAIRGLAKTMLDIRDSSKLAEVIIGAIEFPDGSLPVNRTVLRQDIISALSDQALIEDVLYSDPNQPDEGGRRKLQVAGTPVDSFYCANCYKKNICRRTASWCK